MANKTGHLRGGLAVNSAVPNLITKCDPRVLYNTPRAIHKGSTDVPQLGVDLSMSHNLHKVTQPAHVT